MPTNLELEKKLGELYQQVVKMQNWADTNQYGYSKEKNQILDKLYQMRFDLIEKDILEESKKTQDFLDQIDEQANLLWSSTPRRIQKWN